MRFDKPEPKWITLIEPIVGDKEAPRGVRVKFAPVTRSMKRKAMRASAKGLAGIDLTDRQRILSDDEADALYDAGEVSSRTMIRLAILDQAEPEWDGVLDAEGKPLAITADTVDLVLASEDFFEAAERLYIMPIAERDREKNGSAPSPGGTGGAKTVAPAIAKAARKRAPSAPMRSTRSRPTRGKASGKS